MAKRENAKGIRKTAEGTQTDSAGEAKLLWIDLEMTGLDPEKDRILEVAALATGWGLVEIAQ